MKRIDFEAHFYTKSFINALLENRSFPRLVEEQTGGRKLLFTEDVWQPLVDTVLDDLLELGDVRLSKMNECCIDIQVLSLSAPGVEPFDPSVGVPLAKECNDQLSRVIKKHPGRFMGYAALAPKQPEEAADELERAVKKLGFKGWNTHSNYGDSYLDDRKYWPILEAAEKLSVPIYIHPTVPLIPELGTYGFALAGAPFGFGFDVAICTMRLILSGVFDRYPNLKIILGHLGEGFPFIMKRMDGRQIKGLGSKIKKRPSDYLRNNFYVTTSGNCYKPAFMCTRESVGINRMLLGTDYPYEDTKECIQFLQGLNLTEEEKNSIFYKNAKQIGVLS